jgi:phosphate transport system substrate-binding protein
LTEAVAEEFTTVAPKVRVTVGISGTGGGFQKFLNQETDIANASRPIKPVEAERAAADGIDFIELPVTFDGLSVIVNPENDWADHLTVSELRKIWQPQSTVHTWRDVRPDWPDEEIRLYGPGTDSGTFDYFTETINGKSGASRSDYTASEDDNVLVQGIAGDRYALGYFGFAYYVENQDKLKVVPIDGGAGAVTPSRDTINDGSYAPLSRPLFIYINANALDRPEVAGFVEFYLDNAGVLASEVGYIELPDAIFAAAKLRVANRVPGTAYSGDRPIEDLMTGTSH